MLCVACLLFCLLGIQGESVAQKKDTTAHKVKLSPEARADKMSDKLDRRLNLTNEQDKEIHTINTDISLRKEKIKSNTSLAKKDKMQQIKQLEEERNHRFKSVLTADQYKKWNDWEMKKKERMENKMDKKQEKRSK
jgi:hypothetical protein